MKYCPYCGEPMPAHDFKFCPECGERLPRAGEAPVQGSAPHGGSPATAQEEHPAAPHKTPGTSAVPSADSHANADDFPGTGAFAGAHDFAQSSNFSAEKNAASAGNIADGDAFTGAGAPAGSDALAGAGTPAEHHTPAPAERAVVTFPAALAEQEEPWEAEEIEEPEVFLRPDGWTPGNEDFAKEPIHPRAKKKRRARILPVFLAAVVLLGGAAGYAVLKLRQREAPERAAQSFAQSVYAGDIQSVLATIETAGSGLSSSEDVAAMCLAIKEQAAQDALGAHLLAGGDPMAAGYNEALSSLTFRQTKDSLFVQKFKVRVQAVPVLVKTSIEDAALYVDGTRKEAAPVEEGLLLQLAPGRHTLRAVYEGYGTEYELGSAELLSLSSGTQQEVVLTQKTAAVAIELSGVETGLTVKVDGRDVTPKTPSGWITLEPAFVGMDIELSCGEYAESFEVAAPGRQTLAVGYIDVMEQKNPGGRNPEPDALTNRQLAERLGKRFYTCYRSYLEASNAENGELIRDADESYKTALIQNMKDFNRGYLFEFRSIEVDRRSITRSEEEGERFATVRVEVLYNYAQRAGTPSWMAGFNRQDVTLRYDEELGDWLVYGSRVNDELVLSEDTITIT